MFCYSNSNSSCPSSSFFYSFIFLVSYISDDEQSSIRNTSCSRCRWWSGVHKAGLFTVFAASFTAFCSSSLMLERNPYKCECVLSVFLPPATFSLSHSLFRSNHPSFDLSSSSHFLSRTENLRNSGRKSLLLFISSKASCSLFWSKVLPEAARASFLLC